MRQNTPRRLTTLALSVFVLALGVFVLALGALPGVAAAQQSRSPQISATPAPGASVSPGGWFRFESEPGATRTDRLAVRNGGPDPVVLHVSAVDASTAERGGVAYGAGGEPARATGAWIDVNEPELSLDPGETALVDFAVHMPEGAGPGTHLAGLSVDVLAADVRGAEGAGGFGASVTVRTRQVVAVEVALPGPAEPALVVTGVTPEARPDGVYLRVGIRSTGTALTTATGTLSLPGLGVVEDFSVDTIVPGTEFAFPVRWADPALVRSHPAQVRLDFAGHSVAWDGRVEVSREVRSQLADRVVGGLEVTSELPWAPITFGLALAAAVLMLLIVRWRHAEHRPLRLR